MPKARQSQGLMKVLSALDDNIQAVLLYGAYAMRETAGKLASVGRDEAKNLISRPGAGRYKQYYKAKKKRFSSPPQNPPAAEQNEELYKSVYSTIISGKKQNPAIGEFGADAKYAAFVEFGTKNMEPRPYVRPAAEAVRRAARDMVANDLNIAYNKKMRIMKNPPEIVVEMEI